MPHLRHFLPTVVLLVLPACAAAAATVPDPLVGEWLSGAQMSPATYDSEFSRAGTNSTRLLLNRDGSYSVTNFRTSAYPSSFGFSGYPITCETLDVTVEKGTFAVQGDKLTLTPESVRSIVGMSPDHLNNGCKRSGGSDVTSKGSGSDGATWKVTANQLTLTFDQTPVQYARRTQATPASSATTSASTLPVEYRGEWHSGRISPVEYYNTATGKWAEASGTSVILKLNANFTYERTGLLVVTTYGCTSKLLVQEQGKVAMNGAALTFTPTTSSATGYTCTPSKVSTAKDHVKPYTERALVKVESNGQHVLTLSTDNGSTAFNRPLGTPPESAPGTTRGTITPPPPGATGSTSADTAARPASPPVAAAPWNARGKWDAVITTAAGSIRVRFDMDDDSPRILGSGFAGEEVVGWIQGNSQTGALKIGLEVEGDREVELNVQGRFDGDQYSGRFTTTNANGEELVGGTITMTRR